MTAILLASLALAGCPKNKWDQAILDKHNEWRAATQPAAKDMYKLRWDSAIAQNMHNWLAKCNSNWPHSDQDRDRKNVGGYEYLGENLAYCAGISCEDPIDGIVGYLGQSWWDEKDDYDWANDRSNGGVTSHYTQMSSSNIYAIGCAAVECPSPGPYGWNGKWWEIGCQYGERGQGYWVGTKPFESGSGGLIEPDKALLDKHPDICLGEDDECDKTPCGMGQKCNDPDKTMAKDFVCTCDSDMTKTATGAAADCSTPPPTTPATPPPTPDTPPPTTPATPPPGTPATPPPVTPDTPPPSNNDECQPDPCGAGQTCEDPKKTSDSLNDFTCTCASGAKTTGAAADCTKTTTDECAPAPCGDGQKCNDPDTTRSDDYTCTCNADKTIVTVGMQATCSKDECMPNPCGDGQTCTDVKLSPKSLHDYECVCTNGEKAVGAPAQCTKDAQCANDPCGKFQTCKGQGSTFVCTCATAGATGEAEGKAAVCLLDECAAKDVCQKDQLCSDPDKSQQSLSDFVCTCQTAQGVQMVGSQVGGHASCRPAGADGVDECAAKVSTWAAVCGQFQLCEDTNKKAGDNYVCRCEGDATVRATGRAAACSSVRSSAQNTDDGSSDNWWIWVLVGLGALLLSCCAVFLLLGRGKSSKSVHFNDFFDKPGEEQSQYQSQHNDPLASPVSMTSPAGQPVESMVL